MIQRCFGVIVFGIAVSTSLFFFCNNPSSPSLNIKITAHADSVITVRDTLRLNVKVNGDAGDGVSFWWKCGDVPPVNIEASKNFDAVWQFPDTGMKEVVVYAAVGKRVVSNHDTVIIYVKYFRPLITLYGDTVATVNGRAVYRAVASDSDGVVDHFLWKLGRGSSLLTEHEGEFSVAWSDGDTGLQVIAVCAVDNDGLLSEVDSLTVDVRFTRQGIFEITGDTLISINDTARYSCKAFDAGGIITGFKWTIDRGNGEAKTIFDTIGTLEKVWSLADTGYVVVTVSAIGDNGIPSLLKSLSVKVTATPPEVSLEKKKIAIAGDSLRFSADASDRNGTVIGYEWIIETSFGEIKRSTTGSHLDYLFTIEDAGVRRVSVVAIDDDSLYSVPAVCSVYVRTSLIDFAPPRDTIVSSIDSVTLHCELPGSDGDIVLFYWDVDGNDGWDDSTTFPEHTVRYWGDRVARIIVGIRYEDSEQLITDTTQIVFNSPPYAEMHSFTNGDTVWMGERSIPGCFPVKVAVTDDDNDDVEAYIVWNGGKEVYDSVSITDSNCLSIDTTGVYTWEIHLTDSFGHRVELKGITSIGIEHTICFVGHSIVTGLGILPVDTTIIVEEDSAGTIILVEKDTTIMVQVDSAGFRTAVLASLRDSLDDYERIRPVGPFVPGTLFWNPTDDSCFAISGSFAREMLLLMDHAYTHLTADIWVLMFGVNATFSTIETNATKTILNRMFTRNPYARAYVLTAQPYYGYPYEAYNQNLRNKVIELNDNGYDAFIVSADSILEDWYDSSIVRHDGVHPSMEGHRRLAEGIIRVMWEREPQVIDIKRE